jgi:Zn-finger nucleic acid-binding protein
MTICNRITIEPSDITRVELECAACHTRTVRILDDKLEIPSICGNCRSVWLTDGSRDMASLKDLLSLLRHYATNQKLPFTVRLEIREAVQAEQQAT